MFSLPSNQKLTFLANLFRKRTLPQQGQVVEKNDEGNAYHFTARTHTGKTLRVVFGWSINSGNCFLTVERTDAPYHERVIFDSQALRDPSDLDLDTACSILTEFGIALPQYVHEVLTADRKGSYQATKQHSSYIALAS